MLDGVHERVHETHQRAERLHADAARFWEALGKAERAEHDADTGWPPIERATPTPASPLPPVPG